MTRSEERVLDWITRGDFTGNGCRHSQETIAKATGYTVRTVIRATKNLESSGHLRIERKRRQRNTYHVRDWNPHKRSGVLNVLAAIREQRCDKPSEAECHPKRTASLVRAHTPRFTFLRAETRCQHAARERRFEVQLSEQELMALRMEVGALREDYQKVLEQNTALNDELMAWRAEHRKVMNEKAALQRRETIEEAESGRALQVQTVLDNWRHLTGRKSRRVNTEPGGKRWKLVAATIARRTSKGHDPLPEILQAVEGYALLPFGPPWKREATGRPSERKDDITDIFKDDKTLEMGWTYRAQALKPDLDQLREVWEQCGATRDLWARVAFRELDRLELQVVGTTPKMDA